jgi:hypothetical protein
MVAELIAAPAVVCRARDFEEGLMTPLYRTIVHASGGTYYQGEPISLADAQMMLSNDIAEGKVEVGAFLKIDEDTLILEPADADP